MGGGFFGGLISHTADGVATHALIVAPAATGASGTGYTLTTMLAWKTTTTSTAGATSLFDGLVNRAAILAAGIADHPAAEFCENLAIGGETDWYLPAQLEQDIIYFNLKPSTQLNSTTTGINDYSVPKRTVNYTTTDPAQTSVVSFRTGGAEAYQTFIHWVSNEHSATAARSTTFANGNLLGTQTKTTGHRIRAIRRITL